MKTFIIVYSVGVMLSIIVAGLLEYFFYYDKQIKYISKKEIVQDLVLSTLSWITFSIICVSVFIDIKLGWKQRKGSCLRAKKREEAYKKGIFFIEI
jgi:hypothetical protein